SPRRVRPTRTPVASEAGTTATTRTRRTKAANHRSASSRKTRTRTAARAPARRRHRRSSDIGRSSHLLASSTWGGWVSVTAPTLLPVGRKAGGVPELGVEDVGLVIRDERVAERDACDDPGRREA